MISYCKTICILAIVLPWICLAHGPDNNKLERIEPLYNIKLDIAPRPRHYFQKRNMSPSYNLLNNKKTIEADDHIRLVLKSYDQTFHLHLEPNTELFHPDAVLHHEEGSEKLDQQDDVIAYKGHVITNSAFSDSQWFGSKVGLLNYKEKGSLGEYSNSNTTAQGWARVVVRNDLSSNGNPIIEGAFGIDGELYHVKTKMNYDLVKGSEDAVMESNHDMVIYRDSDTASPLSKRGNQKDESQCGFDHLAQKHASFVDNTFLNPRNIHKRMNQGCPTTKKINYMGVAADCTFVQHYKNVNNARIQIIHDLNLASAVFEETFNVALGIINITIMSPTCPTKIDQSRAWNRACEPSYVLGDRLSDFSLWRSYMSNDGAGLWHLMTNCPSGVEVGLAWLKQLCNTGVTAQISDQGKTQHVSGAGVSAITRNEWKVVAHEIGHGFGAIHDCTSDSCPCQGDDCNSCCSLSLNTCDSGENYLMSPISNAAAEHFSPCSINTICTNFPSIGTCLSDPEDHMKQVYQLGVCGNGIKESGEDCDTGGEESQCCDPSTCRFINNAVCEDKNDGCCNKCQLQPKSFVCRRAETICDIDEYCTGTDPDCPTDMYVRDGTFCDANGHQCASGQCTSRDEQCLSRGYVMNITQSCLANNEECKMLCNSPDSDKCLVFSGNFIDGTPCGFGGRCQAGSCQNGGAVSSSLLWLREHKKVAIPVAIVILILLLSSCYLLAWLGCCKWTGYKDKRQKQRQVESGQLLKPFVEPIVPVLDYLGKTSLEAPTTTYDALLDNEKRYSRNSNIGSESPSNISNTSSCTIVASIDEKHKSEKKE